MRLEDIDSSPYEDWIQQAKDISPYVKSRKRQAPRGSFYLSKAWRELRATVLSHYGPACMKCKQVTEHPHVDHIRSRFYRPDLSLVFDNLQVLCQACNEEKSISCADYRPRD
jgi:5-methylcytosine-specific restriction endonuclease McrA